LNLIPFRFLDLAQRLLSTRPAQPPLRRPSGSAQRFRALPASFQACPGRNG